jgi:hypothetical protein
LKNSTISVVPLRLGHRSTGIIVVQALITNIPRVFNRVQIRRLWRPTHNIYFIFFGKKLQRIFWIVVVIKLTIESLQVPNYLQLSTFTAHFSQFDQNIMEPFVQFFFYLITSKKKAVLFLTGWRPNNPFSINLLLPRFKNSHNSQRSFDNTQIRRTNLCQTTLLADAQTYCKRCCFCPTRS